MVALMHWKGCHIFKNCLLKRCSKVGRDFPLQLLLQVWLSHSIAKCHLSFSASSVSCLTPMIFFPLLLSIIDWRDEEWHMLKCISYLNFLPLRPSLAKIYQNNLQNEEVSEIFFFQVMGVFFWRLTKGLEHNELLLQPLIKKNIEKRTCCKITNNIAQLVQCSKFSVLQKIRDDHSPEHRLTKPFQIAIVSTHSQYNRRK